MFPQIFRDELIRIFDNQVDEDGNLLPGYGSEGFNEYGIYIGKRNVEGGPRASNFEHDGFRIVTGLKGAINDDWDYDISYLYGSTASSLAYINDFFAP